MYHKVRSWGPSYINDLYNYLGDSRINLYADDTTLFVVWDSFIEMILCLFKYPSVCHECQLNFDEHINYIYKNLVWSWVRFAKFVIVLTSLHLYCYTRDGPTSCRVLWYCLLFVHHRVNSINYSWCKMLHEGPYSCVTKTPILEICIGTLYYWCLV